MSTAPWLRIPALIQGLVGVQCLTQHLESSEPAIWHLWMQRVLLNVPVTWWDYRGVLLSSLLICIFSDLFMILHNTVKLFFLS